MPATGLAAKPSALQIWMRAIRIPSLIAATVPVLLGGGLALIDRGFEGWPFLATLIAVMLIQAGTQLFNDYYDFRKGADSHVTLSPPSVIQLAWLSPRQVLIGGVLCYALALVLGTYLAYIGGMFIAFLGLVGLASGFFFTGSRLALAYHRLGELTVFLMNGPLVTLGTYYVMLKIIYPHVIVNGVGIGLLSAAIVHINNLRDREQDEQIGKHTLATMLGTANAKGLFYLLLLIAYALPVAMWQYDVMPWTSLLTLLTLPLALRVVWIVRQTDDPVELNVLLGHAVLLQMLYGILHAFGIFLFYFLEL